MTQQYTPDTTRSTPAIPPGVAALTRESGAFAMLAVDQREALRNMLAEHVSTPVTDEQVTAFKLDATRILSPYASAVLLDKQFVLDRAIAEGVIDPHCALIAGADEFVPSPTEVVSDVRIDMSVDPAYYASKGAAAMKLLVLYRPDEPAERRVDMVRNFVQRCRAANIGSIIEPVSRPPRTNGGWDWNAGVLAAAAELGDLGADLYKAEVPLHGEGDEGEIRSSCAAITDSVTSPWVVLSSGVAHDVFPRAVELAIAEGASGFLAGRAIWQASIGSDDVVGSLRTDGVARLRRLVEVVDNAVAAR